MTEATPARGRPRDADRTAAILDATHTVLHAQGWDDLRVADIADTAGCGLATIYRRWGTKEELVAAAMRDRPAPPMEEVGDPATDLRTMIVVMASETIQMGEAIIGFMAATRTEPLLRSALEEGFLAVTRPRMTAYLEGLLGEGNPHVQWILDAIAGALIMRVAILGNEQTAEQYADDVLGLVEALAD